MLKIVLTLSSQQKAHFSCLCDTANATQTPLDAMHPRPVLCIAWLYQHLGVGPCRHLCHFPCPFHLTFRPVISISPAFPALPPCLHPSLPPRTSSCPLPGVIPPMGSRADANTGPEKERSPAKPHGDDSRQTHHPKREKLMLFLSAPHQAPATLFPQAQVPGRQVVVVPRGSEVSLSI